MSDERVRTFICIEIPASIRRRIEELQRALRSADAQASWVRVANIHLTLKFLGDVERSRIERVIRAVEGAALEIDPFEIEVGGAGSFPSLKRPRVLWVGLTRVADELKRLHREIENRLAGSGFARDEKKFSPHLTIARLRSERNAARVAERLIETGFPSESFTAREVIVMRSELSAGGSIYTPLAAIKLGNTGQSDR
ncbi:MAG: RNA 2',3'-cyclic phosphodiesterase [Acidobacteriota bacterium]